MSGAIRPSVCPSGTSRYHIETAKCRMVSFFLREKFMDFSFLDQFIVHRETPLARDLNKIVMFYCRTSLKMNTVITSAAVLLFFTSLAIFGKLILLTYLE